ncbi:DENN domain-containing protein 10-like [Leptopilina heterotoma]|uniref:DENN domain-containing protein 10-like n=1 Tax=Leptopilina heterotoma TaxID=63436 RepID=UPI001CA89C85|nr:DENN domain-containing protein 10-like [Leptopilina heterotoma]
MAPLTELISCALLEKDCNGANLFTWGYPAVTESQKTIVTRKYNLQSEKSNGLSFVFSRHQNEWFYIYCSDILESNTLPKVKQVATVIFSREFHPQKYEILCRVLSKTYCKTGSPVEVFKIYILVYTTGSCNFSENGSFISDEFNTNLSKLNTNVRELIKTFELETILIYTALLLKKKIIVYHHSVEQLLKWIQTFPALMTHHRVSLYLRPWVDLVEDELLELKSHQYYVMGCTDSSISSKTELYDLLVNLPAREITVANHAKESLTMTKTHKEIALFLVQLSENQTYSEAQIITEIADKTRDLLSQLTSIAKSETKEKKKTISARIIKEKNLAAAVENFLINLAIAENFVIVQ